MRARFSAPRAAAGLRLRATIGVLVVTLAGPVAVARADGDPASDVLVQTPPVFIPAASGISYAEQTSVVTQLRAAAAHGHPLRVAVIPDRIALGSVGALWNQPQEYAVFLGRELSLDYHGELLVAMPDGFGVSRDGVAVDTALSRLAPRSGQLLTATEQAIARLTGAGASRVRMTAMAAPSRTAGIGWWSATAVAALVVVAAWAASLRARPPARRRPARS